jgi:hypothetical protein
VDNPPRIRTSFRSNFTGVFCQDWRYLSASGSGMSRSPALRIAVSACSHKSNTSISASTLELVCRMRVSIGKKRAKRRPCGVT